MHWTMENELRRSVFLLQFYGWLSRGLLEQEDLQSIDPVISDAIDRIVLMRNPVEWDGRNDLVVNIQDKVNRLLALSKDKLKYKQIGSDEAIAKYVHNNPEFRTLGIPLSELRKLLDITQDLKQGYMLHDVYHGYPKGYYRFQVDCLDYCYSAAHFYNEGYDYYHGRKASKSFSDPDVQALHFTEIKMIQSSEEVAFRNFREGFINLVFFVESFISSVGYHGYLLLDPSDENDQNQLRGIQNVSRKGFKNYSNLKQSIENISRILGGKPIDCNIDPIKLYLESCVELRNKYVHSSRRADIHVQTIDYWKTKCDEMIDSTVCDVIILFWRGCFPNEPLPFMILNTFTSNLFKGRPGSMYAAN